MPALAAHPPAPAGVTPATPAAASANPCVVSSPTATIPSSCLLGIAASPTDQALGVPRTVTFLCGIPVGTLKGAPGPGCYDLRATLLDLTTGAGVPFDAATCANVAAHVGVNVDCTGIANPICPPGYTASPPPTGGCSPCPAGFQFVSGQCRFYPTTGICPPGSTPFPNTGGGLAYCYTGVLPATVGPANEFTVSFTPTSPHIFEVSVTGYVPTNANGGCPPGTTLTPDAELAPKVYVTACAFAFQIVQRAEEINSLVAKAAGTCSAPLGSNLYYLVVGQGCLADVEAFGMIVLKVGVNCSNGSEPATGSSAVSNGFPPGSMYDCEGDSLTVTNIPVLGVPLSLTVSNGIFNPECFPVYAAPSQPGTPTATPSVTPLATPRPSPTPTATPTPPALTATPTAIPGTGSSAAYCSPPGPTTIQVVTGPNGVVNFIGNDVEYSAYANPANPAPGSTVDIVGHFAVDGAPEPGVTVFAHYDEGNGETARCGPVMTDVTGTAHCPLSTDSVPSGTTVSAMVDFIQNCTDYSTTAAFTVGGQAVPSSPPVITAPAPNGVCVLRTGPGQLTVSVTYTSPIDTQPPVTLSNVPIGTFGFPTPTPVETTLPVPNATPTPSNTPVPTATPRPTATPTPTSTPTPTPTPTSTPSPTPTSTPSPTPPPTPTATATGPPPPPPVLSFSLDAARVSKLADRGNGRGLNLAQQGQRVNLSIYYTVRSLPRAVSRLTTYEIDRGSRVIFKAAYRGTQGTQQLGAQVRYIAYRIPPHLAPGVYTFRAILQLASVRKTAFWSFAVVRPALIAPG